MLKWKKDGDQWLAGSFRVMPMWSRAYGQEYLLDNGRQALGSYRTLPEAKRAAERRNANVKAP